jgi:hypothetical protein
MKTSSWRSHRAVVSSRADARSTATSRGRTSLVLRGMGQPQLFLLLGQATSAGLWATVKPNTMRHFILDFLFSFTIPGIHINF